MVFGGKFRITRSNSKASYLPRQSREKLNVVDPDHGIYKLTLTSNEDFINHQQQQHQQTPSPNGNHHNGNNVFAQQYHQKQQQQQLHHQQHHHHNNQQNHPQNNFNNNRQQHHANGGQTDILTAKCNNLPDVLPLAAKVHNGLDSHQQQHHHGHYNQQAQHAQQHHSQSPRYGSNNNINQHPHQQHSHPHHHHHQPPPPYQPFSSSQSHHNISSALPPQQQQHQQPAHRGYPQSAANNNNSHNQNNHHHQTNAAYAMKSNFHYNRHSATMSTSSSSSSSLSSPSPASPASTPTSASPFSQVVTMATPRSAYLGASTDSLLSQSQKQQSAASSPLASMSSASTIDLKSAANGSSGQVDSGNASPVTLRGDLDGSFMQRQSSPPMVSQQVPQQQQQQRHSAGGTFVARKLSMDGSATKTMERPAAALPEEVRAASAAAKSSAVCRQDSLKENIDKITQLQSKLMSAHIHEKRETTAMQTQTRSPPRSPPAGSGEPAATPTSRRESPRNSVESVELPLPQSPIRQSPIDATPAPRVVFSEAASQTDESALLAAAAARALLPITDDLLSQSGDSDSAASSSTRSSSADLNASTSVPSSPTKTASIRSAPMSASAALELECQQLSADLVQQLAPSDRLQHILAPKAHRSAAFYVTGLYNPYVQPRTTRRDVGTSTPTEMDGEEEEEEEEGSSAMSSSTKTPAHQTSSSSSYEPADVPPPVPTTPPPTMHQHTFTREVTTLISATAIPTFSNGHAEHSNASVEEDEDEPRFDLTRQKEVLVARLQSKIAVLAVEQTSIADESQANEQLGLEVASQVAEKIRPVDVSKFRSYVDDVGHITMLLLSLSGRLARTENELQVVEVGDSERKTLEIKRDRLVEQLDEAKRLKEDIDRRGSAVCRCLEQHLSMDAYADYDYFINTKARLIVDGREVLDKIKLAEDRLAALRETLQHSEC